MNKELESILTLAFSAGTAIGTIGLATFSFIQIREMWKSQKENLKTEIVDFAKSVSEWNFTDLDRTRLENSKYPWVTSLIIINDNIMRVTDISRNGYIIYHSLSNRNYPNIKPMVNKLNTELSHLVVSLNTLRDKIDYSAVVTPPAFINALDNLKAQQSQAITVAELLFAEIVKLKH
jgi:hypothetical protein